MLLSCSQMAHYLQTCSVLPHATCIHTYIGSFLGEISPGVLDALPSTIPGDLLSAWHMLHAASPMSTCVVWYVCVPLADIASWRILCGLFPVVLTSAVSLLYIGNPLPCFHCCAIHGRGCAISEAEDRGWLHQITLQLDHDPTVTDCKGMLFVLYIWE